MTEIPEKDASDAKNKDQREMTLIGHLGELRNRIIISIIAVVVGTSIAYYFIDELMRFVIEPAGKLYFMSPAEGFFAYLKLAVFAGLMLALPVVLWQIWAFIAPALTKSEAKWALIMVPGSVLLFFTGMLFAYFVVWPAAVKFFLGFGSETLQPLLSLGQYLSFLLSFIVPFGLIFNLPLGLLILAKMGIISSGFLARKRKIMILVAFIIGGIITPTPDVFSQTMMAVPIILLYEASIWAVRLLLRK